MTTALVLGGGGANGAYEVGVMKALFSGRAATTGFRPLDPQIYSGVSVGGYNAAFMAGQPEIPARRLVARLERLWRERIASRPGHPNGVFRVRGSPYEFLSRWNRPLEALAVAARDALFFTGYAASRGVQFLTSRGRIPERLLTLINVSTFVSTEPFHELVRDTIDPDGVGRSPKRLMIAACDWQTGAWRLFTNKDFPRIGRRAVLASAAIPGIFPPVWIDGTPFVDGQIIQQAPLLPVTWAGATEIHTVLLEPGPEPVTEIETPSTVDAFYRTSLIEQAARVKENLFAIRTINQTRVRHRGQPDDPNSGRFLHELRERAMAEFIALDDLGLVAEPKEPVIVHLYRRSLGEERTPGWLDFDAERVAKLIEYGERDALEHDCGAAGCILKPEHHDATKREQPWATSGSVHR